MVKRLAAIAAFVLALIVFAPVAVGHAQPTTDDPGTAAPADDLYAGCREMGDNLGGVVGWLAEKGCDGVKAVTNPGAAAGEFAGGMGESAVAKAAEVFLEGWKKGITFMLSWWMTNSITGPASDDTESTVWQVHKFLRIFEIAAFFISVGISALKLAWARARFEQQHAQEAAMVVSRTVFASWMLVPLVLAADELSRAAGVWLLEAMVGENIDGAVNKLMAVASIGPLLGPGLIFVFSILGILGTAVQAVFILIQIAMLRLVLGWMPIAAAASGIGAAGMQAWTKLRNWCIVFVLFPFVASSVYGIAFVSSAAASDAQGVFAGMILMTLSFLTMPALARLIVPAMGSMAGGSGAAVVGGLMAATGAAAGASMIKGMSSSADQGSNGGGDVQGGRSGDAPTGSAQPSGGGGGGGMGAAAGGGGGGGGIGPSGSGAAGGGAGAGAGAAGGGAAAAAGPAGAAVMAGQQVAGRINDAVGAVASSVGDAVSGAAGGADAPDQPQGGRSG
ncbi:hypothetical protein GS504_03295 [Rhodococcus hoagii]|nr:hypothetical protein [Prescottella equi]